MPNIFRLSDIQINMLLRLIEKELAFLESKKFSSFQDKANYDLYVKLYNKFSGIDYKSNNDL